MNNKFDVLAFGLTLGILWGLAVLVVSLLAIFEVQQLGQFSMKFINFLNTFYVGFEASAVGTIVGTFWAFLDGFMGGIIFAWLYNKISK